MPLSKTQKLFYIFLALFLLLARPAYAYLDPGSGSLIVQMIIAAIVAIPFGFSRIRKKLKDFLLKKKKRPPGPEQRD